MSFHSRTVSQDPVFCKFFSHILIVFFFLYNSVAVNRRSFDGLPCMFIQWIYSAFTCLKEYFIQTEKPFECVFHLWSGSGYFSLKCITDTFNRHTIKFHEKMKKFVPMYLRYAHSREPPSAVTCGKSQNCISRLVLISGT